MTIKDPIARREYGRLHRLPEKTCVKCLKSFPNTRVHFAVGPTGMISKTCLDCHAAFVSTRAEPAGSGVCPACEESHVLVMDRQVTPPQPLCRSCLLTMNRVLALGLIAPDHYLPRVLAYVKYRISQQPTKKAPAGQAGAGSHHYGEETPVHHARSTE